MKYLIKSDTKQSYQGTPLVNKYGDNNIAFFNKFDLYTVMDDIGNFWSIDKVIDAGSESPITAAAICIGQHPTSGKSLFIPLGNLIKIPDGEEYNVNARMAISDTDSITDITLDQITTDATAVKSLYNGSELTTHWLNLMEDADVLDNFPAYNYIKNFGTSDDNLTPYTSGWYLPSVGELLMIKDIYTDLNNYLAEINEYYKINDLAWSSNFLSSSNCWDVVLSSDDLGIVEVCSPITTTVAVWPYLAI